MGKLIKLNNQNVENLYAGRFLLISNNEGDICSIWDIEKQRGIDMPSLNIKLQWQVEQTTEYALIFQAFYVDAERKILFKCVFLKSTGNFLKNPKDNFQVLLFNSIEVTWKTIYGTICIDNKRKEYWFNAFGELLASADKDEKDIYTVNLYWSDIIENVSKVQPIRDIQTQEIVGLLIFVNSKKNNKLFYKFD